jgi:uncharacterized membrane protein
MDSASNVLAELKQSKRNGLIDIEDAVVITKGVDGKSKIRETYDMGTGKGASIGALMSAVLSLIAGPLGWTTLGGGAFGDLAARVKDEGFPQEYFTQLAHGLTPGSSVLVLIVDEQSVNPLLDEIEKHDAKILEGTIGVEVIQQLAAANDALYTVATTGDAVFISITSGGAYGTNDELLMHDNSYANHPNLSQS